MNEDRITKSIAAGVVLGIVVAIVLLITGFHFGGIFGFIFRLLYICIGCGTIAYMVLSVPDALSYVRATPKKQLVPVCLLLPAGVLVSVITNLVIGQPLVGWLMSLFTRDSWTAVPSAVYAALLGLYVWFALAKDSEFRFWPKQLGIFAIAGIAGALAPYGIGLVILVAAGSIGYKALSHISYNTYTTAREKEILSRTPKTPGEQKAYEQAEQNWAARATNDTPVSREDR